MLHGTARHVLVLILIWQVVAGDTSVCAKGLVRKWESLCCTVVPWRASVLGASACTRQYKLSLAMEQRQRLGIILMCPEEFKSTDQVSFRRRYSSYMVMDTWIASCHAWSANLRDYMARKYRRHAGQRVRAGHWFETVADRTHGVVLLGRRTNCCIWGLSHTHTHTHSHTQCIALNMQQVRIICDLLGDCCHRPVASS